MLSKKPIFAIVLVVLVVVGAGFYWHWTRSVDYALVEIRAATQDRDLATFQKYVDVEGVCTRLGDDFSGVVTKQQQPASSGAAALGQALGAGLIEMIKPHIVEACQTGIERAVEGGGFENLASDDSSKDESAPQVSISNVSNSIGATPATFSGVEYKRREGKTALVGLRFVDTNTDSEPTIVELKFRNLGNYWQLAEVSNFSDLFRRVQEREQLIRDNESATLGALRSMMSAQQVYATYNCGFYDTLECLGNPQGCLPQFEDDPIVSTENLDAEMHGYVRQLHLAGQAPPEGRGCSPSGRSEFAYIGFPVEVGRTGQRSFCIDTESLEVCANDSGNPPPLVEDGVCQQPCDSVY